MLTGLLREIPTGDADDAPAIPHTYPAEPTPGLDQRILDTYLGAPTWLQIAAVVGALIVLLTVVVGLVRVARKMGAALTAAPKESESSDDAKAQKSRWMSERVTHILGVYATAASLASTLHAARHDVDGWMTWALLVGLAVMAEGGVIALVLRAMTSARERGRFARDGLLIWVIAGALIVILWQKQTGIWRLAVLAPIFVATFYTLGLVDIARRRRIVLGSKENEVENFEDPSPNPVKVLWRRLVALLGLVEEKGFGVAAWARRRKLVALAQLALKRDALKAKGEDDEEYVAANAQYTERVAKMAARYPDVDAFVAEFVPVMSLIYGAADSVKVAAQMKVWKQPTGTGTPGGTVTGTDTGTPGGTASGTPGGTVTGTAAGTPGGTVTGTAAGTDTVTSRNKATLADVQRIAESWGSADLLARKSDFEAAHLHAMKEAREVFGRGEGETAAVRTYALHMFAASHTDLGVWNMQRIHREVIGDPQAKTSTLPGRVAKKVLQELSEDPDIASAGDVDAFLASFPGVQGGGTDD